MNAMQQMATWENDRERMTAESARQKQHKSSNIQGQKYYIE